MDNDGLLGGEEDALPPTISKLIELSTTLNCRHEFETVNPWQMLKLLVVKATATTLIVDIIIL